MLSLVFIHCKKNGVRDIPTIVKSAPAHRPKATFVCIARLTLSSSFAPKYFAITIPAPCAVPMKNEERRNISGPEDATAARALVPRNLPTINVSAVL